MEFTKESDLIWESCLYSHAILTPEWDPVDEPEIRGGGNRLCQAVELRRSSLAYLHVLGLQQPGGAS